MWAQGSACEWAEAAWASGRMLLSSQAHSLAQPSFARLEAKPWPLPLLSYSDPAEIHAICRRKFWLGSAKLSGWSQEPGIDNHLSRLPPPNTNLKRKKKKKNTTIFLTWELELFGGLKGSNRSCPISSCTDTSAYRNPQNHISFFIFQSVSLTSPSLQNYPNLESSGFLKRSWFYGSILPSLSWFYGSILPS